MTKRELEGFPTPNRAKEIAEDLCRKGASQLVSIEGLDDPYPFAIQTQDGLKLISLLRDEYDEQSVTITLLAIGVIAGRQNPEV